MRVNIDTVFIEITNICDKKCKHCFNDTFNNVMPSEISIFDFKKIFCSLKSIGVNQIKIVGGEPTLHSEFEEILSVLDMEKVSYVIFTDHRNIVEYVDLLKKCVNLSHIRISLDGNKKIHDYIRGEGSYVEMLDVIKTLKFHKIPVKINYTINKLNCFCIAEVYEMARVLDVEISYSIMKICKNKFCEELLFTKDDIEYFMKEITQINSLGHEIISNILKDIADDKEFIDEQKDNANIRHIGCLAGQKNCVVDSYGNVWPCSLLKGEPQYNYGNILGNSMSEIVARMKMDWSNLSRSYDECDSCKFYANCTGGCRSNAYYAGGIEGKDPYCKLYSNLYYGLENMRKV